MNKEKSRVHPELLKIYNSPIYRKRVKKVTEGIKLLRGMIGTKLPGKPNKLPGNASEKEREEYAKIVNFRVSRESAHYWAQPLGGSYEKKDSVKSVEKEGA